MTRQEAIDRAVRMAWREYGLSVGYRIGRMEECLTSREAVAFIGVAFRWLNYTAQDRTFHPHRTLWGTIS